MCFDNRRVDLPFNQQIVRFAIKPKNIDDEDYALSKKASVKVDTSNMAQRLRIFYARKALCGACMESGKFCPYNYDPIACIYASDRPPGD